MLPGRLRAGAGAGLRVQMIADSAPRAQLRYYNQRAATRLGRLGFRRLSVPAS